MSTFAKHHPTAHHGKHHQLKFPSLKAPSSETIVFICAGVINLIFMLLYLPDGFQTILAYPMNLGVIVMFNLSVMFILWLDKRHYSRSIAYGFMLPFLFVVATGILPINTQPVLAKSPQNNSTQHIDKTANIKPADGSVVSGMYGTVGQNGWYTSPIRITFAPSRTGSIAAQSTTSTTISQEGINKIDVTDGEGGHAQLIIPIDTAGPTTEWVDPDPGSHVSGVVDVHTLSTDTVSYPALVQVSLDNGKTWQSVQFPGTEFVLLQRTPEAGWSVDWDTTGLTPGSYTLLARAQDVAGNWGNTASLTLIVGK